MEDWLHIAERVGWRDLIDIGILSLVAYRAYVWLRGTVALQVLGGMTGLVVAAVAASQAGLVLTAYLLQASGAVATLLVIVLFQSEIRNAFREADPVRWWRQRRLRRSRGTSPRFIALAGGLDQLVTHGLGALIVLPRTDKLDEHLTGGTELDARVEPDLLEALFHHQSPLHDGAIVLDGTRITRAAAVLPLSSSADIPAELGTRHRAAIGLTERCDAMVVVVSEERSAISSVTGGDISRLPARGPELATQLEREYHRDPARRDRAARPHKRSIASRLRAALAFTVILLAVSAVWTFTVGDEASEVTWEIAVELRDAPEGLTTDLLRPSNGTVKVRLRGPRRLLYSSSREDVRAWVDLGKAGVGRTRLDIRTSAPPPLTIEDISPAGAVVRIRPHPE